MEDPKTVPTVEQLVEEHLSVLYRFAFRLCGSAADAEDLVQETFLIAQRKLHQLRDGERALAWLFQILRRCYSHRPRQWPTGERIPLEELADSQIETNDTLEEIDTDRLLEVLGQMEDEFREPLLLFYFEGFRYREIAEILDCPIGTVMSRLARAKSYLRSRLAPQSCAEDHR